MSINIGLVYAATAFVMYGLYPLYFKQLQDVPSIQIALHRVVWSVITLFPIFLYFGDWTNFRQTAFKPRTFFMYTISAVLLGGAWILFLWGVLSGYIIETSLGYFMNPVFSVVLAVIVLKESLRFWQKISVLLAFVGVLVVAIGYGKFPWLGITLGASLSIYGLLKKTAPLNSLDGVMLEVSILFVPAFIGLVVFEYQGTGAFFHSVDMKTNYLLMGSGIVTITPLLLFASAAQRISFTVLGLVQYIGPIINFLLGIFLYHESFSIEKLIGFILVWLALTLFGIENIFVSRHERSNSLSTTGEDSEPEIEMFKEIPSTPISLYKPLDPII